MELSKVVAVGSDETLISEEGLDAKKNEVTITADPDSAQAEGDAASGHSSLRPPPLTWKLAAILLVTFIGFGSQWSGGITGAMKTTMKKEMKIDNTQFALLEASEDFMVTALMLVSGIVTDRIGGAAIVFLQNVTELAEQRFGVSSITAGWYTATSQYAGFFIVPLLGVFLDMYGNLISILLFCGVGMFTPMLLLCFGGNVTGAAASLGVFAFAYYFGPTTIIDSIRTSLWHPSAFGSAYALKITMSNAMNIIVRVITGVIQDPDHNSYDIVVIVYAVLAGVSVFVSLVLATIAWRTVDLRRLQWTRKQRMAGFEILQERRRRFFEEDRQRNKNISMEAFGACMLLILGSWCRYFWGVATGNNS
ncbi:hypothetical protein INS49_004521 [Diaporthe citri]|uniref:uncharacterized protein n=1 Tax=Diaporthe citri TaxID=83186 RepID=UPI001C82105E|nr:uncharacterized protein INS49_004521 [Diaporthe citri]KAG6354504.1 hypothetical protein INS49_004521 [Diaporthe citri]